MATKRLKFIDAPARRRSRDDDPAHPEQLNATMLVATFPPGQYHTDVDEEGRFLVYKLTKLTVQEVGSTTDGVGNKITGGFGRAPMTPAEINARNARFWGNKS